MELRVQIKMNEKLFLRDPELTELGKKIINYSIILIHKNGFEAFTFRKLAEEIGTTEAGVYRYFENKHRLLIYLTAWYWSWLEYRLRIETRHINQPEEKLKKVFEMLATTVQDDDSTIHVNESLLHQIVISEGSKVYLTNHVSADNKDKLFKPYKDLCSFIAEIILAYNPKYKYPQSLSCTIIEIAHLQNFFMHNIPSLTDYGQKKDEKLIAAFLEDFVFSSTRKR